MGLPGTHAAMEGSRVGTDGYTGGISAPFPRQEKKRSLVSPIPGSSSNKRFPSGKSLRCMQTCCDGLRNGRTGSQTGFPPDQGVWEGLFFVFYPEPLFGGDRKASLGVCPGRLRRRAVGGLCQESPARAGPTSHPCASVCEWTRFPPHGAAGRTSAGALACHGPGGETQTRVSLNQKPRLSPGGDTTAQVPTALSPPLQ